MQKIVPHLWYDKEAKEAADFYVSAFGGDSAVTKNFVMKGTPSGDCDIVSFHLRGHSFMAISAGPAFTFNPSISFIVGCESREEVDSLWEKLSEGGEVRMPIDAYPFSERFGWCDDKYGLSWQLILKSPEGDEQPKIIPAMMFANEKCGKAEEAQRFYLSIFKDSKEGTMLRYGSRQEPDKEGTVMYSDFKIEGVWLASMDSAYKHAFDFNEAVSFIINCKDQTEIDYYWEKLSAVPEAEQCGWVKDKYGVSWQIVPVNMEELMSRDPEKTTPAMLKMKKIIIAELERAG